MFICTCCGKNSVYQPWIALDISTTLPAESTCMAKCEWCGQYSELRFAEIQSCATPLVDLSDLFKLHPYNPGTAFQVEG